MDPQAIERCRARSHCERCGPNVYVPRYLQQVAHIKSRGSGGDDVDDNLILLCIYCHGKHHSGQIKSSELREIVSKRNEKLNALLDFGTIICESCHTEATVLDDGEGALRCVECGMVFCAYASARLTEPIKP